MEKEKKVILIVEDEIPLIRAESIKLAAEGFRVLNAKNGLEGLTLAIENKPDLIILDINMPVMDGITMLKKLREDKWGETAHVIVLTNMGGNNTKLADAVENGITEYLVKTDQSLSVLVEKIKTIL